MSKDFFLEIRFNILLNGWIKYPQVQDEIANSF
jgi:hypothetical protein